jgi:hypothetical protein
VIRGLTASLFFPRSCSVLFFVIFAFFVGFCCFDEDEARPSSETADQLSQKRDWRPDLGAEHLIDKEIVLGMEWRVFFATP